MRSGAKVKTGALVNGADSERRNGSNVVKNKLFGMTGVLALALMGAIFVAPACKAQSEINPDHFDGTDSWATAAPQPPKPAASVVKATLRTQNAEALVVSIPFAFTAGRVALPAGEYRVQKSPANSVILIRRTGQSGSAFVTFTPAVANAKQVQSKLVFHRHGNRYFLSELCMAGYSSGNEFAPTPERKEAALFARNETPDQVTIAARLVVSQP